MLFTNFLSHTRYSLFFFFFNDTPTTEIYTLSLHDALPIFHSGISDIAVSDRSLVWNSDLVETLEFDNLISQARSEEHTSELQSQSNLVCRLLLEKKKKKR